MDFTTFEENIQKYIQESFNEWCTMNNTDAPSKYINDYIDLDKYNFKSCVFFDFDDFTFDQLSNESMSGAFTLTLLFVMRHGTNAVLKPKMDKIISEFYNWFYNRNSITKTITDKDGKENSVLISPCQRNFNGLVDYGTISGISFYDAPIGDESMKATEINIDITFED